MATVNLGSLDGLTKGGEIEVSREERSIGRLLVMTVFRERARCRIVAGQVRAKDQVRAPAAAHLEALLQHADALRSQGDTDGARKMAEKAVAWAETATALPAEKRKALARLAALEYQAGLLQPAETHYQLAVDKLKEDPQASVGDRCDLLNGLAVLRILRGDYGGAEAPLSQAVAISSKTGRAYAWGVNNLGVLAEVRGDRQKAANLYGDAARAIADVKDVPAQQRQAVEGNLSRVKALP